MAKQIGIFPIKGKLDNVVFYQGKEGYMVKTKGSLDKDRVKSDPAFAGSRRANVALGCAARGTKLLRQAMGAKALEMAGTRMAGNMNGTMMRILKEDMTTPHMDEKLISRGNLQLLKGYAWNAERPLRSALHVLPKVNMDRGLGELEVSFDSSLAKRDLHLPVGVSHYEFFAVGAVLDFEGEWMQNDEACSGKLPVNNVMRTINLRCYVPANSALPMVLGLGVIFYQEVNGAAYELGGNCFEIVGVEGSD